MEHQAPPSYSIERLSGSRPKSHRSTRRGQSSRSSPGGNRPGKYGFTIVELLIVIVIIAVLAAITVVAYRGIQERARDAQRLQDAKTIEKALRLYLTSNGTLPSATSVNGNWEQSNLEASGNFMEELVASNTISKVPIDPANTSTQFYQYYRYLAGSNSCDASKGDFIVFQIMDMETSARPHPQSPGFSCPMRNWSTGADYTFGIFENE